MISSEKIMFIGHIIPHIFEIGHSKSLNLTWPKPQTFKCKHTTFKKRQQHMALKKDNKRITYRDLHKNRTNQTTQSHMTST